MHAIARAVGCLFACSVAAIAVSSPISASYTYTATGTVYLAGSPVSGKAVSVTHYTALGAGGSQTVNTPRPTNVSVSGGYLHLTTRHENASCYGQTFPYTSALIETGGHYNGSTHQYDTPPQFTCTAPSS